jgi:hypothetical protein
VPTSKPTVSTETLYVDHDIFNQTFTDTTTVHSPSAVGTVTHSLAQSKFGNSSIKFDGDSDYISVADSDDWSFGSGDFTVEAQVRPSTLTGTQTIISHYQPTGNERGWFIDTVGGEVRFGHSPDGIIGVATDVTTTTPLTASTWSHIVAERSGNTLRIYVDGAVEYTNASFTDPINDSSEILQIGAKQGATANDPFTGYIEEVSVLKGTARYDGNFTPPTAAYSTTTQDFELDSITFTTGSAPSQVVAAVIVEPIDSITINTDLTLSVSLTATLGVEGTDHADLTLTYYGEDPASGGKIYTAVEDVSTITSGTNLRYYYRGTNDKDLRVHGTYLYYI